MVDKPRVLFLCTGNACRSQMAEGWLRELSRGRVVALSAGTKPAGVDARAVSVMAEVGIDLSRHTSDPVTAHLDPPPDLVVAVCDAAAASCPSFPGTTRVLRWPFPDPAGAEGDEDEVLRVFRDVRDRIRERVAAWVAEDLPPLRLAAEDSPLSSPSSGSR